MDSRDANSPLQHQTVPLRDRDVGGDLSGDKGKLKLGAPAEEVVFDKRFTCPEGELKRLAIQPKRIKDGVYEFGRSS